MKSPSAVKSAAKLSAAQVRGYFASLPPDARRGLKKIREAIRAAAPSAVEGFSYQMPVFRLDGRPLVWYAAWKQHYGLYPVGGDRSRACLRPRGMRDLEGYDPVSTDEAAVVGGREATRQGTHR